MLPMPPWSWDPPFLWIDSPYTSSIFRLPEEKIAPVRSGEFSSGSGTVRLFFAGVAALSSFLEDRDDVLPPLLLALLLLESIAFLFETVLVPLFLLGEQLALPFGVAPLLFFLALVLLLSFFLLLIVTARVEEAVDFLIGGFCCCYCCCCCCCCCRFPKVKVDTGFFAINMFVVVEED